MELLTPLYAAGTLVAHINRPGRVFIVRRSEILPTGRIRVYIKQAAGAISGYCLQYLLHAIKI